MRIGKLEAAAAVGADDVLGTLELGKLADSVLLDENPLHEIANASAIWRVIQGGQVFGSRVCAQPKVVTSKIGALSVEVARHSQTMDPRAPPQLSWRLFRSSGRNADMRDQRTGWSLCGLVVLVLLIVGGTPDRGSAQGPEPSGQLPEWLSLSGSFRLRPEARWGRRFEEGDNEGYALTRLRVAVGVQAGRWARFFVEGQDSRAPGLATPGTTLRDWADLYQGYAEVGSLKGPVRVRVGRQEMPFGAERLLSRNPWRNTGRSFDAVRVMVSSDRVGVDLFAASVVEKDQEGFDSWVDGENLYGLYGSLLGAGDRFRIEPYLLVRTRAVTETRPTPEDRYSLGARVVHRFTPRLEADGEVVRQLGDAGDASIAAWMAHGVVRYDFAGVPWRPRVRVEYAHASGSDPDDAQLQGFDTLYRTPHRYHGFADLIGGRNLRDAQLGVDLSPPSDLSVAVDLHRFWLATTRDGLYSTGLGVVVPVPLDGADSSDVGVELDLTVTYPLLRWLTVGGGWARLFPGQFLKTNASDMPSSFAYGLVEARF